MYAENNFFQDFWKKNCKFFFLRQYLMPHSILSIYVMPFKVIRHCWKYKFVSAYILNSLCVFYISKIRHEYFVVYREYADGHNTEPISANFWPKNPPKIQMLNYLCIHYRMGKIPISRYCPFKPISLCQQGQNSQKITLTIHN
jgi:hypothetical protein